MAPRARGLPSICRTLNGMWSNLRARRLVRRPHNNRQEQRIPAAVMPGGGRTTRVKYSCLASPHIAQPQIYGRTLNIIQEDHMTERNGHCLCAAVQFRLSAEPLATRVCWCRDCQHIAANGTVNLLVPTVALAISGQLSEFTRTAKSGNEIRQRFCPICGSHLFANSPARPQFTVVRAGTLDDPSSVRPTVNIWSGSAPAWACLDPALERVEQQPAPPQSARPPA